MEDGNELKKRILEGIQEKLAACSEEELFSRAQAIEERLFQFANFLEARMTLFYTTRGGEIPTETILARAAQNGRRIALPLVDRENRRTTIFRIDQLDTDLVTADGAQAQPNPDRCKALSPEEIDVAIIPGLAFDEKGGRIGVEDNFYDKFVAKLPVTTRKVALAYDEQVVLSVPSDTRNKHIDIIITDKRIIYKI